MGERNFEKQDEENTKKEEKEEEEQQTHKDDDSGNTSTEVPTVTIPSGASITKSTVITALPQPTQNRNNVFKGRGEILITSEPYAAVLTGRHCKRGPVNNMQLNCGKIENQCLCFLQAML